MMSDSKKTWIGALIFVTLMVCWYFVTRPSATSQPPGASAVAAIRAIGLGGPSFVHTWTGTNEFGMSVILIINDGGMCSFGGDPLKWRVEGSTLVIYKDGSNYTLRGTLSSDGHGLELAIPWNSPITGKPEVRTYNFVRQG